MPQTISFDLLPLDIIDLIFAFVALTPGSNGFDSRITGGSYESRIGPLTRLNRRALPAIRQALERYVFVESADELKAWGRALATNEDLRKQARWLAVAGEYYSPYTERGHAMKIGMLGVICASLPHLEVLEVEITEGEDCEELASVLRSLPSLKTVSFYNDYDELNETARADRPVPVQFATLELVHLLAESISANVRTLVLEGFQFCEFSLAQDNVERKVATRLGALRNVTLRESREHSDPLTAPVFVVQLLAEVQQLERLDLRLRGRVSRVNVVLRCIGQHQKTLLGLAVDCCDLRASDTRDLLYDIRLCSKLQVLSWCPQALINPRHLTRFSGLLVIRCAILDDGTTDSDLVTFTLGVAAIAAKHQTIRKVLLPGTDTFSSNCLHPMTVRGSRPRTDTAVAVQDAQHRI